MKNKNLIKTIGITLLTVFVLTWIIPASTTTTSGFTTGSIMPIGIADIFSSIEVILFYFSKTDILILFVGMLYGVLNKSGVFKTLVDKLVSKFKKKSWLFVILTVLFYSLTTALTGISTELLIFMPFTIAVLLALKYNKLQSILATVGSVLIGLTAELSSNVYTSVTSIADNEYLPVKLVLLAVMIVLEVLYLLKIKNKKDDESTYEVMFKPEDRSIEGKKTKGIATSIIMCLLFVILVLGLNNWNTSIFNDFHELISNVKIGNFEVLSRILGTTEVLGAWTMTSVYLLITVSIILISIFEKMKFSDIVDACVEGAKKLSGMVVIAFIIPLVVIFTLNSGFLSTVINLIAKSGNIILVTIASLISSPFMVEETYSAQYLLQIFYTIFSDDALLSLHSLVGQITYGFTMLASPTSVLVIIMLYYLGENYKNWIKYVWKLLLVLLTACLIAITIATLL